MTAGDEFSRSDNEAEDSFDLLRDMHSAAANHRSKAGKRRSYLAEPVLTVVK